MIKRELREEARRRRAAGESVREIALSLGVARSSVSNWARDIKLSDAQIAALQERKHRYGAQNKGGQANRRIFMELRKQYQDDGRFRAREGSSLHMAGCMLYWAEGAKEKNNIIFANSDPNMLLLFMRFLRDEFGVDGHDVCIYVHCHSTDSDEHERIKTYWLNLLKLPTKSMRRIYVKKGSDTRKNRLEYGVCRIEVHSTRLLHHIYGAIQEYGGFDNPDWLF